MGLPINVLCVEDREDDTTLLCLELRRAGYDVIYERVETADDMRRALESRPWDVVVSDYSMPGFSAPEALEVLHDMGLDIPFIIVSGTIGEDAAVSALRAGAQDFFTKDKLARLGPAVARELREAQDRRQRRQAEMNLHRAEARFSKVFQASPVAIVITTRPEGRYIDVNDTFLQLFGYSRDEVLGRTVDEIGLLEDPAKRARTLDLFLKQGVLRDREVTIRTKSGEIREVSLSLEIITLDDAPCLLSLFQDVTGRKRAETAIREREQRFRLLAENSTDMISRLTAEGVYLYVSPACYMLLGYQPEEMIGRPSDEFLHPDDLAANKNARLITPELPDSYTAAYRIRRKDGRFTWFESSSRTIREPETGRIVEIQAASRDIADRVNAEAVLRRYNQRLETLHALDQAILGAQSEEGVARFALQCLLKQLDVEGVSIVTFNFDEQRAVIYAAAKGDDPIAPGASFGLEEWEPEDIAALRAGKLLVMEDSTPVARLPPALRALQQKGLHTFLRVPLFATNELLGVLDLSTANPGRLTTEFVAIAREIAAQVAIAVHSAQLYDQVQSHAIEMERRVAERTAELQRAKERAETILNNSSDAVAMTWNDGRIQQTNPAFNRLLGYAIDDAVSQTLMPLAAPEQQQAMADAFRAVVAGGQSSQVEINSYPGDGVFFDAEVVLSPILDEGQRVSGVVCIVHDMTKRNQVERELQELNQLKTEFLSTAAHELRTPLTSILGFSEILLTRTLAESRQTYFLGLINSQALQLSELINDLLDIARLEGNRSLSLDLKPVNVNELLDEVLMPFMETSPLHQFQRVSPEQLPLVVADRFRLGQVFKNLISNAVKYSPNGGAVTIHCQRRPEGVQVSVRDEGIGMTPAQLAHVFEKFYRADASNTAITGTGLGLAISKLIVELHGGKIWVESEDGCCTSITFTLPLRDETGNVT